MPALFSLGQQPALQAVQTQLQPGETLYAFLDDIYAVVQPDRVRCIYGLLANHLEAHAHIRLNQGKTRIWNRGGHQPANTQSLGPETWAGNRELPPTQQGLTVLGAPHRHRTVCAAVPPPHPCQSQTSARPIAADRGSPSSMAAATVHCQPSQQLLAPTAPACTDQRLRSRPRPRSDALPHTAPANQPVAG